MPLAFSSFIFRSCRFGVKKVWTFEKLTLMELNFNYITCELFSTLLIGKSISCRGFGAWEVTK
jgi:hypothetical protein